MEQPRIEGTAGTLHQVLLHDELGVVEDTRSLAARGADWDRLRRVG